MDPPSKFRRVQPTIQNFFSSRLIDSQTSIQSLRASPTNDEPQTDDTQRTSSETRNPEALVSTAVSCCSGLCCVRDVPNQPTEKHVLEKTKREYSDRMRSVQASWFQKYSWLSLCETSNKLFCYFCRKAEHSQLFTFSKNVEKAFSVDGFQNWKKATTKLKDHEQSQSHAEAVVKTKASAEQNVAAMMDRGLQKDQELHRKGLICLMESVQYLLRQGLAIRGHGATEGNLMELMKLRGNDVGAASDWVEGNKYTSPEIINEIISLMGNNVLRSLLAEVREAGWFAIIADETTDMSNKEQFNICVRWVDDRYEVYEEPLGFVEVPNTSSETITKALKDVLVRCNLDLGNCRGQAYDGAANMQGRIRGVATRIQNINPKAISVHCLAHCINLCLQDVSRRSKPLRDALDLVFEIVKLIKFSPKRSVLFADMQVQSGIENPRTLRPLCPTRWTVRTGSLSDIISKYQVIMDTLDKVSETCHDEYGRRASGQASLMEKFSTFFGFKMAYHVFCRAEQMSINIQGKNTSVEGVYKAVSLVQTFYKQQRSDEEFRKFYSHVVAESEGMTERPTLPRKKAPPKRIDEGSEPAWFSDVEDYFRVQYFEVLDVLISELDRRFNQKGMGLLRELEILLQQAASGEYSGISKSLEDQYKSDVDWERLNIQLKMLPDLIKSETGITTVTSMETICQAMSTPTTRKLFSEVHCLLKLYFTAPVTSSTSERSHSVLRRVKTYLRSTMSQQRLNNTVICHAMKDRTDKLDLTKIARDFCQANDSRSKFFGVF